MTNEMLLKAQELFESEAFGKEIETCETVEEIHKALEAHGVELTLEETEQICVGIAAAQNKDALGEADLDNVSGGGVLLGIAMIAGAWAFCYVAGYVVGKIIKKKTGVCY